MWLNGLICYEGGFRTYLWSAGRPQLSSPAGFPIYHSSERRRAKSAQSRPGPHCRRRCLWPAHNDQILEYDRRAEGRIGGRRKKLGPMTSTSRPFTHRRSISRRSSLAYGFKQIRAVIPIGSGVFLSAFRKSSLSHALMIPGRAMNVASGKVSFNAGRIGPFGPSSELVVKMVGSLK